MFIGIFSQNSINLFLDVLKYLSSFCNFELIEGRQRHNFISKHLLVNELNLIFWLKIHFLVSQLCLQLFNFNVPFLNLNPLPLLLLVRRFLPQFDNLLELLLRDLWLHLLNDFLLTLSYHIHHIRINLCQHIWHQLLPHSLLKSKRLGPSSQPFMGVMVQLLYLRLILGCRLALDIVFILDQFLQTDCF